MTEHRDVPVKVNAWVDEGIADLVSALSEFDGIVTLESCQGGSQSGAWVCFRYGSSRHNSWRELAEFVLEFIGPKLADELGDVASVRVQVTSFGTAQGEISVAPGAESKVAKVLKKLRTSHKFGYSCGKSHTSQPSC